MGWLPFLRAPTSASAADSITKTPAATSASTDVVRHTDNATEQFKPTKSKAPPVEQPALTEAEQLDLLVGGARLDASESKDKASFLRSNKRHIYLDAFLSCAVYTFSGLQHLQGQSNALTLLTMWTVGTTFLVDAGERMYLQEALQGKLSNVQRASGAGTPSEPQQQLGANDAPAAAPGSANLSFTTALVPQDAAKLAEQQRKIFMTPTVASWVWMLASFQQFKVHKRLKWCGYSSWMGLGCMSYYTTRHMYNLLVA